MTNLFQKNGTFTKSGLNSFIGLLFIVIISLPSCMVSKTTGYFKNITRDTTLNIAPVVNEELKIKKGDVLSIFVTSLNRDEDEIYNRRQGGSVSYGAAGYQVDNTGEIYLHNIGKVKAEGFTRKQLKFTLEDKFIPFLKDAVVSVNFENHHVTVIGEIGKSQLLPMPEEKISIIDVLAQSGNVTALTELSNVLVIREKDNVKELKRLNLEDQSILNSSFYYLQPNDIVVLNLDEKKVQREIKRQNYQQVSTIILQALTMTLVIYQTFFRK